jgi:hypothetical protein
MVWNIKLPELNKAKFLDALKATASRAAETIASIKPKSEAKEPQYTITAKAGKPGVPYRRIIAQKTDPVWFVQCGINPKDGTPRLQRIERHRFLHATKGWRVYNGGLPGIGRAHAPTLPRNPHREPLCHRRAGITTANRKGAPVIHLGWRKIATVTKDGTIIPLKTAA